MPTHRTFFGLVVLLALALAGCSGGPSPALSPTPTGFASEQDAASAAEETYRAYVAAINARNAGDPDADPTQYLAGELRATEAEIYRQSDEARLTWQGELKISSLERNDVTLLAGAASIKLDVCMDASEWRLINADGDDVTLPDAPVRYATAVEIATISRTALAITAMVPDIGSAEC
jgi:hypothetical protein